MPDTEPFDLKDASSALVGFTVEYLTIGGKYRNGDTIPDHVLTSMAHKTDAAMKAGLACLGEITRMRNLMTAQRTIHLPMPPADTGSPVLCQQCSLHGASIPWPCGVWTFVDQMLADRVADVSDPTGRMGT